MSGDIPATLAPVLEETADVEQAYIYQASAATVLVPTLKIYRYTQTAIILGRSQRPDQHQLQRAARYGLPLIRRKSGGGAVMAGPEMLSVTALFPPGHAIGKSGAIKAYNWMGVLWQKVLGEHGVACQFPTQIAARNSQQTAKRNGTAWACYSSVSHGELLSLDGRKLLGLAQIRTRCCSALTSGIYLSQPDWRLLSKVIVDDDAPAEILQAYNASLADLGISTSAKSIAMSFQHEFQRQLTDKPAS